jgi:hypothetical protein
MDSKMLDTNRKQTMTSFDKFLASIATMSAFALILAGGMDLPNTPAGALVKWIFSAV